MWRSGKLTMTVVCEEQRIVSRTSHNRHIKGNRSCYALVTVRSHHRSTRARGMARILVIEDESDIRQVLDYNLRLAGHEVVAAARGQDGLRLAREHRPDLVLLDLMLPDLA